MHLLAAYHYYQSGKVSVLRFPQSLPKAEYYREASYTSLGKISEDRFI